jgi:hypothetical protein
MTPDALLARSNELATGRVVVPCDECDEELHDRISRLYRLGPRCRQKLGIRVGPGVGRFEVPQDGIPGL